MGGDRLERGSTPFYDDADFAGRGAGIPVGGQHGNKQKDRGVYASVFRAPRRLVIYRQPAIRHERYDVYRPYMLKELLFELFITAVRVERKVRTRPLFLVFPPQLDCARCLWLGKAPDRHEPLHPARSYPLHPSLTPHNRCHR